MTTMWQVVILVGTVGMVMAVRQLVCRWLLEAVRLGRIGIRLGD